MPNLLTEQTSVIPLQFWIFGSQHVVAINLYFHFIKRYEILAIVVLLVHADAQLNIL